LGGPRFLVGLTPGAAFGPAKRWLLDRYASLADRLIGALNADVLIFGSPSEKPLAEEIARGMSHTPVIMTGSTTLRQLMALLAQCRLVITNDSGPMHLAAALGLPVVAIFGSTDETATGPVSPLARVVRHPVACSPCGLRECPIDFRCMKGVTVDQVHRTALGLIKEYGVTHERPAAR
jgi:heptosyltransferase-2